MIDKIILRLEKPVSISTINQRILGSGLPSKRVKLRDGQWYQQIGLRDLGTFCKHQNYAMPETRLITTNPSSFSGFRQYLAHLSRFLSPREIASAVIQRLDFAVDYCEELMHFLMRLDVPYKQISSNFITKKGAVSGVILGSGTEKVVVYDKRLESQKPGGPLTRLECQLKGKKNPFRKLHELPQLVDLKSASMCIKPFKNIRLHRISLVPVGSVLERESVIKHTRFKTLLDFAGYSVTKKQLNPNRTFFRDYGEFFSLVPDSLHPDTVLETTLLEYFADTHDIWSNTELDHAP